MHAIDRISTATGLQFINDGPTTERASATRGAFQPHRYGDTWVPVLIAWTDPATIPDLAGDVEGIGGSTSVSNSSTRSELVYVTGIVYLDGPGATQTLAQSAAAGQSEAGRALVEAVIVHELGHVVGMQHVNDDTQIMNPTATASELGAGDRTGLAKLGTGNCFERL